MASGLEIDQASLTDNDMERQIEFTAEIDGEERDFAVKYSVLTELSGDEPEDDALEVFERFSDEIADFCLELASQRPSAKLVVLDKGDLE